MPGEIGLLDIPRGWTARGSPVQEETVSRAVVLVKNPKKGYAATKMLDFSHRSLDSGDQTSGIRLQTSDIRLQTSDSLKKGQGVSRFAFGLTSGVHCLVYRRGMK
jgi:hypothetical protein